MCYSLITNNFSMKDIKATAGTIRADIIDHAEGEISYIKDVAEHGCIGGNCSGLVYTSDCEEYYNKHADEIDELLETLAEEMGESYDITANMKRLGQTNLRNFLAWLAYEVNAQEIMKELDPNY